VAGKLAGTRGIQAELNEIGIHPNEAQLADIVKRVKELGDKGKLVTDADLIAITSAVMGQVVGEEKIVDLCDMAVITGIKVIPTASVRLMLDGKEYVAAETGVGPVDAVLKAIQKLTNNVEKIRLSEYRLEAITGGSNAVAEVVIKVEDEKGNIVSARAAREDIVMASVEAMINGINKCLLKNRNQGQNNEGNLSGRKRRIQRNGRLQVLRQQSRAHPLQRLPRRIRIRKNRRCSPRVGSD
jgi:2-isopropylmalate synthase